MYDWRINTIEGAFNEAPYFHIRNETGVFG